MPMCYNGEDYDVIREMRIAEIKRVMIDLESKRLSAERLGFEEEARKFLERIEVLKKSLSTI